jgi:hypothetical protein
MSKSSDWHPDFTGDFGARVWFPDLIKEGEWHHIVIVLNRQVIKNSTFSLFVNGQHITTQRFGVQISSHVENRYKALSLAISISRTLKVAMMNYKHI